MSKNNGKIVDLHVRIRERESSMFLVVEDKNFKFLLLIIRQFYDHSNICDNNKKKVLAISLGRDS